MKSRDIVETTIDTAVCKVCRGYGYIEGMKCIYCTDGRYKVERKEEDSYEDPKCGGIVEF